MTSPILTDAEQSIIAELDAAERAATKGPWEFCRVWNEGRVKTLALPGLDEYGEVDQVTEDDFQRAAFMRNNLRTVLDIVARLAAEVERLRTAYGPPDSPCPWKDTGELVAENADLRADLIRYRSREQEFGETMLSLLEKLGLRAVVENLVAADIKRTKTE